MRKWAVMVAILALPAVADAQPWSFIDRPGYVESKSPGFDWRFGESLVPGMRVTIDSTGGPILLLANGSLSVRAFTPTREDTLTVALVLTLYRRTPPVDDVEAPPVVVATYRLDVPNLYGERFNDNEVVQFTLPLSVSRFDQPRAGRYTYEVTAYTTIYRDPFPTFPEDWQYAGTETSLQAKELK